MSYSDQNYHLILEDLEDLQDLRNAKKEEENSPSIPLSEVKKMLNL